MRTGSSIRRRELRLDTSGVAGALIDDVRIPPVGSHDPDRLVRARLERRIVEDDLSAVRGPSGVFGRETPRCELTDPVPVRADDEDRLLLNPIWRLILPDPDEGDQVPRRLPTGLHVEPLQGRHHQRVLIRTIGVHHHQRREEHGCVWVHDSVEHKLRSVGRPRGTLAFGHHLDLGSIGYPSSPPTWNRRVRGR